MGKVVTNNAPKSDELLNGLAAKIVEAEGKSNVERLKSGALLAEAHEHLVAFGCKSRFGPWVEKNFSFTVRTAYNRIRAYDVFGGLNEETISHIAVTAMYLLANNQEEAPEAIKAALAMLESGKTVTVKCARELIGPAPAKPAAPRTLKLVAKAEVPETDSDDTRQSEGTENVSATPPCVEDDDLDESDDDESEIPDGDVLFEFKDEEVWARIVVYDDNLLPSTKASLFETLAEKLLDCASELDKLAKPQQLSVV